MVKLLVLAEAGLVDKMGAVNLDVTDEKIKTAAGSVDGFAAHSAAIIKVACPLAASHHSLSSA